MTRTSAGRGRLVVAALVAALVLPATLAGGERKQRRVERFTVTLTASVSGSLSFAGTERREGCTYSVAGGGSVAVALRSARASVAVARPAGRRLRLAGAVPLSATSQSRFRDGERRAVECSRPGPRLGVTHCDPAPPLRVRGLKARFRRLPDGRIVFRPVAHPLFRSQIPACGYRPAALAAPLRGLELAVGRLPARKLLDARVRRIVVSGSSERSTRVTVDAVEATVERRVRWKLTLTRLPRRT